MTWKFRQHFRHYLVALLQFFNHFLDIFAELLEDYIVNCTYENKSLGKLENNTKFAPDIVAIYVLCYRTNMSFLCIGSHLYVSTINIIILYPEPAATHSKIGLNEHETISYLSFGQEICR